MCFHILILSRPVKPFTQEEIDLFVGYLAERVGPRRSGIDPYIQLVDSSSNSRLYATHILSQVDHPEFPWAKAHSWQAWQNQYKKNKAKYDKMIDKFKASHHRTFHDSHGELAGQSTSSRRNVRQRKEVHGSARARQVLCVTLLLD